MQPVEAEFIKTEAEADLLDLIKRRDELLKQKQMEKNRLEKSHSKIVESSIRKHIKWLEKELEKIDKQIL